MGKLARKQKNKKGRPRNTGKIHQKHTRLEEEKETRERYQPELEDGKEARKAKAGMTEKGHHDQLWRVKTCPLRGPGLAAGRDRPACGIENMDTAYLDWTTCR